MLSNECSEHLAHAVNAGNKRVDLLLGIVQSKGSTHGSQHPQTVHQRLCTVMTRTDSDAQTVKECTQIHVVDIAYIEADDSVVELRVES